VREADGESHDPLRPGDLFEREYQTPHGTIGLLAEIAVEGTTLHLSSVAIYPSEARKLEIGAREVLSIRNQLVDEIRRLGFERLRLTGRRFSGAAPGRRVEIVIDLTRRE
jgi:hypothetical protein